MQHICMRAKSEGGKLIAQNKGGMSVDIRACTVVKANPADALSINIFGSRLEVNGGDALSRFHPEQIINGGGAIDDHTVTLKGM